MYYLCLWLWWVQEESFLEKLGLGGCMEKDSGESNFKKCAYFVSHTTLPLNILVLFFMVEGKAVEIRRSQKHH